LDGSDVLLNALVYLRFHGKQQLTMFSKTLASYRNSLDEVSRRRYDEKCALIGKIDPYVLEKSKWSNDVKMWASVSYPDIVNFLLFSTSAYTMTQLKSYKGLDAYNQFINGWVRDSVVHCVNNVCLHAAKVSFAWEGG